MDRLGMAHEHRIRTAVHEMRRSGRPGSCGSRDDLPLLLGVAVVEEDVDLRERVERDRVRVDVRDRLLPGNMARICDLELAERLGTGAGDGLVGVDDDALEPDRVTERHENRRQLHRRAVGVRDDPRVALEIVRVHLRDHERDQRIHPPCGRVVDHGRAGRDGGGRQLPRRIGAGREQRDVDAVEGVGHRLADLERPAVDRDGPAGRATRRRRRSSPTGNSRSLRIWIIVRPTTPVAPTTATVRG
jgi:hypothetical protein